MYGYIRAMKPELRFREYDTYRACYCGLCSSLQEQYGTAARWTLSYDMTFLILLLSGLYEPEESQKKCRCMAHPLRRQLHLQSEATTYAADMSILLYHEKCIDDWMDEHKISRRFAASALYHSYCRVQEKYPEKTQQITIQLQQLHTYEKAQESNPDLPAGCFGRMIEELFAWRSDVWEADLRKMGFYLGKFIYLLDAYDDLDHDRKKKCYNPLMTLANQDCTFHQTCESLLKMMMASCAEAFERLPILRHADILRNILYAGVWVQFYQKRKEYMGKTDSLEQEKKENGSL